MTNNQIKWASLHDWFQADLGNGRVLVAEDWTQAGVDPEGVVAIETQCREWRTSESFGELRAWAGY